MVEEQEQEEEKEAAGANGQVLRRHTRRRVRHRQQQPTRAAAEEAEAAAAGLVLSDSESESESVVSVTPPAAPPSLLSVPLPGHEQLEHACLRVELQVRVSACIYVGCACIYRYKLGLHFRPFRSQTHPRHDSRRSTARCSAARGRSS